MITTAHVYTTLFIHLGVVLVATAYYVVAAAILPHLAARSAERMARRPIPAILLGLGITLPWMGGAIVLMSIGGPIGLIGVILALAWVFFGLLGGAGIAEHVGRMGGERDGWRSVARGGFFMTLTWALPLLGWFVALPLTLAAGIGCLVFGLRRERMVLASAMAPASLAPPSAPLHADSAPTSSAASPAPALSSL